MQWCFSYRFSYRFSYPFLSFLVTSSFSNTEIVWLEYSFLWYLSVELLVTSDRCKFANCLIQHSMMNIPTENEGETYDSFINFACYAISLISFINFACYAISLIADDIKINHSFSLVMVLGMCVCVLVCTLYSLRDSFLWLEMFWKPFPSAQKNGQQ